MIKTINENSDSDDSEDDQETLERLREAVDSETLKDNFYSQKSDKNNGEACLHHTPAQNSEDPTNLLENCDDPKILSFNIKKIVEKNQNNTKLSSKPDHSLKSLRREKQREDKSPVISELEVTPQFQKFVGSKLDEFLSSQIEEDSSSTLKCDSKIIHSSLKLLKRSKSSIENTDYDHFFNQKIVKPDLLAHTRVELTEGDLESVAITGERVLSQEDTRAWVNKFPNRVEPGIERIKKKKKKVKKKKSASTSYIVECFPMQDAGLSLRAVARWTSLLPPVSLVSCILWSLTYNYDKATYTHCEVPELLPSISSVIGGFELQRFLWTFSVAMTTGPRIVFCKLQQNNLSEKFISFKRIIKWNFYLNVTEILCLLTLSLVPSSEIFLLHATAFSVFIMTSLLSMTMVTYYIRDTRNRRTKKNIVTISWVCVFLAFYFYNRHNEYCEPYIYTGFAMCEYLVVGCNMVWHSLTVNQFSGFRMVAEPYMELK